MGGKSKQSQRTKNNVRPSSSARSAELLSNAMQMDQGLMGSGHPLPMTFTTLAAALDTGLDPELSRCLKKLNKKDPITKTKALQELSELVKNSNVEEFVRALPLWAHYYRSLSTDTDHKVRESVQVTHSVIVSLCGRRIAPLLKTLVPLWLQAQYDDYAPAAAAARNSLNVTFPEHKLPDVLSFCKNEIVAHLSENLVGGAEATLAKKMLSPEDKEIQHARLMAVSIQALDYFTQHLPGTHDEWLWAELNPMLQSGNFWKLAGHKSPLVKASWYAALGRIIIRFNDTFGASYGQKTGRLLLSGTGGAQLWGCLLVLMHHVKDWHTWLDKKELLAKRIIDVLENGGWGDAKHLSSMLLPLLAHLPEQMLTKEFYESFFTAVFKGLEKKAVVSSKSERQSWLTSLSECLQYLTIQNKDYVVEVATVVHRTWLETILLNQHNSQTSNNLIKHSTANMVALVKYWLKQSKEANGEKYDQLVRNFWQNVAATFVTQIEKLSTDGNGITRIIEGYTLFLQSMKISFSIDAKKPKSITFNDEKHPETILESEESTHQCDASTVDRYNHNLNLVVQKICAQCFEYASKKQLANYVFPPLLPLIIEFNDKDLFLALARHFDTDSIYALYDKILRDWLASDTMQWKAVANIVFLSMKHMSENEQEATLNSFNQFRPSVVTWCISLALSHPHCTAPAVRKWLRSDLVETTLVAVCKRMIRYDDGMSRSLLLMCLAHDKDGETLISPSSISLIVELVVSALSVTGAPEQLARSACALCSELGASPELARSLLSLQLCVPRGDSRLSIETWSEMRSAWQEAGAGSTQFRADAVQDVHEALSGDLENIDIQNIEHIASLCPYLLPRFDDEQTPGDIQDTVSLTQQLFNFEQTGNEVQTHALRYDCICSNLNCLFDDNDNIKTVIEGSATFELTELTKTEAVSYLSKVMFRATFLKTIMTHRDEDNNPWCEQLFKVKYFEEEFGNVLHDYAMVCSLYEGYPFWCHYSIISLAKSHLSSTLDDVIVVMSTHIKKNILAHISELASTKGYYWSYAKAMFEKKVPKSEGEDKTTSAMENWKLEEIAGNGFFHTIQADAKSNKSAILISKYLLMLRSFYLAHAEDATVIDETFLGEAAACKNANDFDVIVNACHRHQHTMLYESDIAAAEWRQVVSNAAILDYLTAVIEDNGWDAPAHLWDFATISLCSITKSVLKSIDNWGSTKVALLARSVFSLHLAVHTFVLSVEAECMRRQPSEHVARLPQEWKDMFAPDLTTSLLQILLKVLEAATSGITSPQAVFISSLHPLASTLNWQLLPEALQATLKISKLLNVVLITISGNFHHTFKYLAHSLLYVVIPPLVFCDAEVLSQWIEDLFDDDIDTQPVELALADVNPALGVLQDLADTALQPLVAGEDTCEIQPFTDSYSMIFGYLLLAESVFDICNVAHGDLTHHYLEFFKEPKNADVFITVCLRLLPHHVAEYVQDSGASAPPPEPAFVTSTPLSVLEPSTSSIIAKLACRCLFHCARWTGLATRVWWGAAPLKAARALEKLLKAYVTPVIIREQFKKVAAADDLEDAEVTVYYATREVICLFYMEDRPLELKITFGANHPLTPPRVALQNSPAQNTQWMAVYLGYQNGSAIQALRLWMDSVTKHMEAAPQCFICYCRIHPTTGRMPRVPCQQCKNKFHAHCLRKWFASSNKSNCPLCRASF